MARSSNSMEPLLETGLPALAWRRPGHLIVDHEGGRAGSEGRRGTGEDGPHGDRLALASGGCAEGDALQSWISSPRCVWYHARRDPASRALKKMPPIPITRAIGVLAVANVPKVGGRSLPAEPPRPQPRARNGRATP